MTKKNNLHKTLIISLAFFTFNFSLFICSCDQGQLGDADRTDTYYPGNIVFDGRLGFLSGLWYSRNGLRLLDSYQIRKCSDLSVEDKEKAQALFPSMDIANIKTYATQDTPEGSDYYIFLYDDTVFEPEPGDPKESGKGDFCYMGIVRAINIFNNDIRRGAIIIEYFEGADPAWLSDPGGYAYQYLSPGEKPFFGIYFKVLSKDSVQLANPVDLAAMNAGKPYYTE
jgi:hypothetical protein